jgi:alpha 1,2-mannosyltransferase
MQDLRAAIAERLCNPPIFPEGRFAGRGIVTCAGGQRYFACAWVLISILRHVYRTNLPIQVWHLGRNEMSEAMQLMLEEQGAEVVNAETVLHRYPATIAGAWPLKAYAIAHSRFHEVIFLDADTVPFVDPGVLFDWESYSRCGLLLWPDVIDLRKRNPIWTVLGLEPRNCKSVDSGVIAIDKRRAWRILDLAMVLNEYWREAYKYLHGDKDTFLIAALLTGASQPAIEHRPLAADGDLIQRAPNGDPFLQHRTGSKWKLFGTNQQLIDQDLARSCEEAITELRRRWTGAIFNAPPRTQRAKAAETELSRQRRFRYDVSNGKPRDLELLSAGAIGGGRTEIEQHWAVVEREGDLVLQFFSGSRRVVELLRQPDGSWRGASLGHPGFDATLLSEEEWRSWPNPNEERVQRTAEAELTALLDPCLFASGFDSETEHELQGALSLLNRLCDDVPELITAKLALMKVSPDWHAALEDFAATLKQVRDARLNCTPQDLVPPVEINPQHYTRIF